MAATHLDVGLRCIKYLLCAVNSLFVLTGIMITSVGTTIYAVYADFSHFLDPKYFSPATLLIVVGVLVFVIAFFGCCGALRESTCMVLVFAVMLSLVLILELSAAIAAYALQDNVRSLVKDKINSTMHRYEWDVEARSAVDFMQSRIVFADYYRRYVPFGILFTSYLLLFLFHIFTIRSTLFLWGLRCCGYSSMSDWDDINLSTDNGRGVPDSCCVWDEIDYNSTTCGAAYSTGCMNRLSIIIHRSALYIGTGAVAIALIQMTGIMFACMLGRAIRRQKTERERRKWELRQSIVNGYKPLGKTDPFTTFPIVYMQSPDYPLKGTANC